MTSFSLIIAAIYLYKHKNIIYEVQFIVAPVYVISEFTTC